MSLEVLRFSYQIPVACIILTLGCKQPHFGEQVVSCLNILFWYKNIT